MASCRSFPSVSPVSVYLAPVDVCVSPPDFRSCPGLEPVAVACACRQAGVVGCSARRCTDPGEVATAYALAALDQVAADHSARFHVSHGPATGRALIRFGSRSSNSSCTALASSTSKRLQKVTRTWRIHKRRMPAGQISIPRARPVRWPLALGREPLFPARSPPPAVRWVPQCGP
jgi:hypothetical protein